MVDFLKCEPWDAEDKGLIPTYFSFLEYFHLGYREFLDMPLSVRFRMIELKNRLIEEEQARRGRMKWL